MTSIPRLLGLLRRELRPATPGADAPLLERFALHRDEAAFAELLQRHGALVRRVCRRALADTAAADDAFQATFLVLARRAGSIQRPERLAGWLQGVACRVARKAAGSAARRARQLAVDAPEPADPLPDPLAELSARDLLAAIDEEVVRLPDRQRLPVSAAASSRQVYSELKVWDVATGKLRFEKDGSGQTNEKAYYSADFSPDSKHLLVARGDRQKSVELIDAGNGKELATLGGAGAGLSRALFSPDGKTVAAWWSETKAVTLFDVATRNASTLKGHTDNVRAAAFTPDGKSLVTAALDGTARVWDAKAGKERARLPLSAQRSQVVVDSLTLSPDGKLLVALGQEGRPVGRVWELSTGKELVTLAGATRVLFSPDGRALAVAVGGSRWDSGGGGFGPRKGEKKEETPDKVRLVPVAEVLKGGQKLAGKPD